MSHYFATNLHHIVWMNYELRLSVSIEEAFTIIIKIHLETVLWKTNQVGIIYYKFKFLIHDFI